MDGRRNVYRARSGLVNFRGDELKIEVFRKAAGFANRNKYLRNKELSPRWQLYGQEPYMAKRIARQVKKRNMPGLVHTIVERFDHSRNVWRRNAAGIWQTYRARGAIMV